ncbi:MAG: glycosyltransferase family 2 protein [Candidatus Omnitrophica bacterium]|nr:glycosyltransferase family 2 protein [Candidatus Omnitrophota bacterium]
MQSFIVLIERMKISAIISTTEKGKNRIEEVMDSFNEQSAPIEDIYIIYEGDFKDLEKKFSNLKYPASWVENKEKCSLTFLQNQIIGRCKTDLILLHNDDVLLEKDFLKNLLPLFFKDKSVAMATGKILRLDKKTLDTTGQFLGLGRNSVERGYNREDIGQFDQPGFVFGACGAAVLYRKEMLEDIVITPGEYFDNDYHMFYEDLDISWRAHNFKWKAYYNPKAVAFHVRGATAKAKEPAIKYFKNFNFAWLDSKLKADLMKNRYMTIIKNDSLQGFILNLPWIIGYDLRLLIYCVFFDIKALLLLAKNTRYVFLAFKKRKLIRGKLKLKAKTANK